MLKDFLDFETYNLIIRNFNFNDINEIRMRINQKLIIIIKNKKYFLKNENQEYVITTKAMLDNFIRKASENSIYAYNQNIIEGYITLPMGIRVGLCGEVVSENGKVITIKNYQAVNIRIPHQIKNCSLPILDMLLDDSIKNTLIISAPGCGKTTFIRDLVYQLNIKNISLNTLIADERNEISSTVDGVPQIEIGPFCDVYTNCTKEFAFKNGIRSMRPDVIITDEIDLDYDMQGIIDAINSGVAVVATIHAKDLNQLKRKKDFNTIIENKYFSRYVVLTNCEGPGTISYVYDNKLNCIYCR